ncbi:hypothetical protein AnigIFM63309_003915 [Aspergillus niger]|nr:hypothetical protein AnigIFM63309_003915 [Aspergillus niger]
MRTRPGKVGDTVPLSRKLLPNADVVREGYPGPEMIGIPADPGGHCRVDARAYYAKIVNRTHFLSQHNFVTQVVQYEHRNLQNSGPSPRRATVRVHGRDKIFAIAGPSPREAIISESAIYFKLTRMRKIAFATSTTIPSYLTSGCDIGRIITRDLPWKGCNLLYEHKDGTALAHKSSNLHSTHPTAKSHSLTTNLVAL